ncbi:transporter substrate-binding domain-containing protein [Chitinibacter sp. SCUT-21]|uniref:substrate-binding periplasmic protein n=1 Tax=Chitinibacter sp. SCUT-21 TaxID=2970891 RepID=UPI0035A6144A
MKWLLSLCCLIVYPALALEPLRVGIGETKLPYVSSETQSGIEYEIIQQAFKLAGIPIRFEHMPNKRAQLLLSLNQLDAAINTKGQIVSEPYIVYQNMAISRCASQFNIQQVSDLQGKSVVAFHNANQFLGEEFAQLARDKAHYQEISPQQLMNRMLLSERVDVVISDINIFRHFNLELDPKGSQKICPFAIFPPTRYRLEFNDAVIRDRFNLALQQLSQNGFYEKMAQKYLPSFSGNTAKKPSFQP